MNKPFEAMVLRKTADTNSATANHVTIETLMIEDLSEGDVVIRVEYSSLNYKDALAVTGTAPIARKNPLVPGIDLAGVVEQSENPRFGIGESVLLTGWGVGEKCDGGFSQYARVRSEWLLSLPDGLSSRLAMAAGTAGLTAMLSVMALEEQGVRPSSGDVLVTGATGGVGSIAVMLLAAAGYSVTACTGKPDAMLKLQQLGAQSVIDRSFFSGDLKPLDKSRWAGAIDVVGSATLAHVLSQMQYGGIVTACGLAQGMDLPASVAPFILRGVKLIGIDSVACSMQLRSKAWQRLTAELDFEKLLSITQVVTLDQVQKAATQLLAGQSVGRILVKCW